MRKYYNLLQITLRENKRNRQDKRLTIILVCVVFMIKLAVFVQIIASFISANGVDVVSQAALRGMGLMAMCIAVVFLLCFAVVQLMKIQDASVQINLLKVLGYRNGHIVCYTVSSWFITMIVTMLLVDVITGLGGLWILCKVGITSFNIQVLILCQAIGYSDGILFIYTGTLFLLQYILIEKCGR